MKRTKIAIIGASGFGREVADIVLDLGYVEVLFLAKCPTDNQLIGFPLLEETKDTIQRLNEDGFDFVIGIGDPKTRKIIIDKYPYLNYPNIIHPTATFGHKQKNKLEKVKGNIITAGCRFTNNITFGNFGVFNLNTVIGHDSQIEDFVSIMSNVVVSGNIKIETGVYIGSSAVIVQGSNERKRVIGAHSFIGIGAVVVRRVKNNTKVFGNPAVKI